MSFLHNRVLDRTPVLKSLIDILFPPVCPVCEEDTGLPLCRGCDAGFSSHLIKGPMCVVCGVPFASKVGDDRTCGKCLMKTPPFKLARSVYVYEGVVLESIHRFKYSGKVILAGPLGHLLAGAARGLPARPDVVVPVPLHPGRLRSRGFNQSLLLARRVSGLIGVRLDYLSLKRTRPTRPQVNLNSRERRENVKGAFEVKKPDAFKGKKVLLVDDVLTTGSTVRECARVAKGSGAEVFVLTLARAA